MFYLIQNQTVMHKGEKKLRAYVGEYIESEEDWPLGSSYIEGVFGEPVKTYEQELSELDAEYESKFQSYSSEYGVAIFRDGLTESAKVAAARTKLTDLDTWYAEQSDLLIIKYFS